MPALVVWVEGDRDSRFVQAVIKPRLEMKYSQVVVKDYRRKETPFVNRLLRAMEHEGFSRWFLADLDAAPCVTSRREKVKERYPDLKDEEIFIVSTEIESWCLAGLSAEGEAALKVTHPASTDRLTKEDLERLRPPRFETPIFFLLELLRYFDPTMACQRNKSFAYFHRMLF